MNHKSAKTKRNKLFESLHAKFYISKNQMKNNNVRNEMKNYRHAHTERMTMRWN